MSNASIFLGLRRLVFLWASLALGVIPIIPNPVRATDYSFTNAMAQGQAAAGRGEVLAALKIYDAAAAVETTNAANLCVLSRRLCDLMYVAAPADRKAILDRALECSLAAVRADGSNSTAHACVAVCYAKECAFASIKDELNYSRLFKLEAERSIALDPKQDIGYYLLGRWNYGVANVGMFARAFVKMVYGGLPKASNEAAIENFKKAIELAPDRIINHAALAMVYEAENRRPEEIAELEKCRALHPLGLEDEDAQRDAVRQLAALGH
jgi:tetratricopeptide (TPR) repeat protein